MVDRKRSAAIEEAAKLQNRWVRQSYIIEMTFQSSQIDCLALIP